MPEPVTSSKVALYVLLKGYADSVDLRLYSSAFVRVTDLSLPGSWTPGWGCRRFSLPPLPDGLYFGVVTAVQGGNKSRLNKPVPLMLLR